MGQCRVCRFYEPFITDGPVEEHKGLCRFPKERLPLSMAGFANRERETVPALATTCPTHEPKE